MTPEELVRGLKMIVGPRYVLTRAEDVARYATGFRFGSGTALAAVRPGNLVELWRCAQRCVEAQAIIIPQAANTGLTGGSTPYGDYGRLVVILNTTRIRGVYPINDGRQVVCLAGATLYDLERALKPLNRDPHSVIGSSCIGATVIGGVCNNSGGALVQRGPAFTECALFGKVDETGSLRLVNHLGVNLGTEPELILHRLERGRFGPGDIENESSLRASDTRYTEHVRDIEAATPARYNADGRSLFEASGCAGKLLVLAVRLDTFPRPETTAVFYLGSNDVGDLTRLRRDMLKSFATLPVAAEYIHSSAFRIAERYGKDTILAIEYLGTDRLPLLFALKAMVDRLATRWGLGPHLSDRLLQRAGSWAPSRLPARMIDFRDRFEHHLLLRVSGSGIEQTREYLNKLFPSASGGFFECTADEGRKAFLLRFAVAGAAIRYRAVHADSVEDIIALDIALPRNATAWTEILPAELDSAIIHKIYYGHFFCHVFHQDYVIAKGHDPTAIKHEMLRLLDQRGAEYPAEHNVGHLYRAKASLVSFYRSLDPCNQLNPGIGETSRYPHWHEPASATAHGAGKAEFP